MRIVSGTYRGRAIDAPAGDGTRPTTDRVREALFSSLFSARGGFDDAVVLDAFAGSGALGIEALSRGAKSAVFCERDRKAASVVRGNLRQLGIDGKCATVVDRDVFAYHPKPLGQARFNLLFLDPPYAYGPDKVLGLVRDMITDGLVAPEALIVYERDNANRAAVEEACGEMDLEVLSSKKYGKTAVDIIGLTSERGEE